MFNQTFNTIKNYADNFFQDSKMFQALHNNDIDAIKELIFKTPALTNTLIKGQTPLVIAVKNNNIEIVRLLLLYGADIFQKDNKGLCAIDYAAFGENNNLIKLLTIEESRINDIVFFIQNLLEKITQLLNEVRNGDDNNHLYIFILLKLSDFLNNIEEDYSNAAKLLDLYAVANTIFNITSNYKDEEFKKNLYEFLQHREDVLKGDSHDYCFANSLANRLCSSIVQILSPFENPLNILLHNATNQDRKNTWQNPYTLETDLPLPHNFFRSNNNHIHLYEGILERAIAELKAGETNLENIWLQTDLNSLNLKNKNNISLSAFDLKVLANRTPTFKVLIEYTKTLEIFMLQRQNSLFYKFRRLAKEISDGFDRSGEAQQKSHVAIANFSQWWNMLSDVDQDKIKGINKELQCIIDRLTEQHGYCVVSMRKDLNSILSCETVRLKLNEIDETLDYRVSHTQLNQLKEKILDELSHSCPISADKNIFRIICNHEYLFNLFTIDLDYKNLSTKLLNDNYIFTENKILNTGEQRMFAVKFVENLINNINDPNKVVNFMDKIFELEFQNPLLIKRIHYYDAIKGYKWKNSMVSHLWVSLVDKAKEKILDICSKEKSNFMNDDKEIMSFLATPTARFSYKFHKSTSSIKQYKTLKDDYISEHPNALNPMRLSLHCTK